MNEMSAVSSLGVTVLLALYRPRLGRVVVGPALAALIGLLLMWTAGHLSPRDIRDAWGVLWHALIAIASIMIIASAAGHLGVIDRLAATVVRVGGDSARTLFPAVFCLSAGAAAVLNNDSAILVLTPLVVVMVRQLFPHDARLPVPFAFAVFMAAGVAPLVTSNPINLIVSDVAGLDFNDYAAIMIPIALVSATLSYLVLRWLFSAELRDAGAARTEALLARGAVRWRATERHGLVLALAVLGAYPIVAYLGGSVWLVAACGALVACLLCAFHRAATPVELVGQGVAWQILVFLFGVYMLALGLRNAGAVDWLVSVYSPPNVGTIGVVSALGSALINNHSMALTNIVAIGSLPGTDTGHVSAYLAALIGGDLGPRLLPIGSLAGLLWYAILERMHVRVPIRQFMLVGALVTAPSLAGALAMLVLLA